MSTVMFQPLGSPITGDEALDHVTDIDPRLTRTNYFDGQLLTAEDLTRDQLYLDQRLRELGRVLGGGIMSGLDLSFDKYSGRLTLSPGQALSKAGRVLELGSELEVDLGDRALISGLNDGNHRHLNRALYAVVLQYAEVNTDIAEVFPKELSGRRSYDYALITESVQLGLVPLPVPLPHQNPLQTRARLIREFLGNDRIAYLIPEDGVALGVLAVQNDRPQWLDAELLRHPLRTEPELGDLQADLSRQYEQLLSEIEEERRNGGLNGDFPATNYFSLLPPVGDLPKDSLDPVRGRQGYFPENYQVSVAPIRMSDVELIKAESLNLPPIDLSNGEPVDIVVLVPLTNQDYGRYAQALERDYEPLSRRLPQLDLLKLKLYPTRPVHKLDTDAGIWNSVWTQLGDNHPFYVRRPTRAAETAVSGIVLAQGSTLPSTDTTTTTGGDGAGTGTTADTGTAADTGAGGTPDTPLEPVVDTGGTIIVETNTFFDQINFQRMGFTRPPQSEAGMAALKELEAAFGKDMMVVEYSAYILMRIERFYDALTWQTLLNLAKLGVMEKFLLMMLEQPPEMETPKVVVILGEQMGIDPLLLRQWASVA